MTCVDEFNTSVRADISGAACKQNIHFKIPFYAAYKNDSNVGTIIASTRIRMMIDDIIFCVFFFLKFMLCSFIRKLPYNI